MLKITGALAVLVLATTTHAADLRFGTDAAYPPYEYKLPDGRLAGLDIDIGNALCAAAKVKCVWVENSFDGMVAGLQSRKFDAINSALAATDARRAVMDFTAPLYPADIRLVAKKGGGLRPDPKSLSGKHVGVLQGSVQAAFAKANWAKNGVSVDEYADQNAVYADLANGRLDATLVLGAAAKSGFLDKPQGANFELAGPRIDDPGGRGCHRREEERCENTRHARRRAEAASRRRHDRQAHAQASGELTFERRKRQTSPRRGLSVSWKSAGRTGRRLASKIKHGTSAPGHFRRCG